MKLVKLNTASEKVSENELDNVERMRKSGLPKWIQRLLALAGLVAMSPLLIGVAILIRLESPGAAIFTQNRVGLRGRRFKLYKFRSMRIPSDPKYVSIENLKSDREGVCAKLFNDPRITKLGAFIRKFSIDELPQLINVVKGDMLLIGPRPALPKETDVYSDKELGRLSAEPGLTGLWQVSGRADTTFEEQIDLDLRYVKERGILADLKILFQTIPAVITGRGAY